MTRTFTVTVNPDGSIDYTPDADFSGIDTFTYEVCDVDGACTTATVTVTVSAVNDGPDAVDRDGETALMFFDGEFSHAIRKAPLLFRDQGPTRALFAPEKISSASRAKRPPR